MPNLMDMPLELRSNIIDQVFHLRNGEAPRDYRAVLRKPEPVMDQISDDPKVRYKRILDDPQPFDDSDDEGRNTHRLAWPKKPRYRPASTQLERVSKTLSEEVKKVKSLLNQKPTHWIVALTYLRHVEITCDFVSLPVLTDYVDTLTIEFRALKSGPEFMSLERSEAFLSDVDSQYTAIDTLFAEALQRVIEAGPAQFAHGVYRETTHTISDKPCRENWHVMDKLSRRGLKIKTLIINFLPATEDGMLPLGPIPDSLSSGAEVEADAQAADNGASVNNEAQAAEDSAQTENSIHLDEGDQYHSDTPADTSAQDYFRLQLGPDWSPVSTDEKVIVSEILCACFHQVLKKILKKVNMFQRPMHCWELYNRVGAVELHLGGEVKHQFNLLEELHATDLNAQETIDAVWAARHKAERLRLRRCHELDLPGPMMPFKENDDPNFDYSKERWFFR